jgi:hypothetical protein
MADHAIDAIRYALVFIYKLGATSSLSDVYSGNRYVPTKEQSSITLDNSFSTGNSSSGFGSMEGMTF